MTEIIIKRLREPSSWAGVAALLALAGVNVEGAQAIGQAGAAVAGALAIFLPERRP